MKTNLPLAIVLISNIFVRICPSRSWLFQTRWLMLMSVGSSPVHLAFKVTGAVTIKVVLVETITSIRRWLVGCNMQCSEIFEQINLRNDDFSLPTYVILTTGDRTLEQRRFEK